MSYGKARGPIVFATPTSFLARDEFDQSAGSLSGKTLPVGGAWSGAGDSDDFTIDAAAHLAQRTATGDADFQTGRYAIAGSTSFTAIAVQVDFAISIGSGAGYQGVFARYTDVNNWLMAVMNAAGNLLVLKRVAGTTTTLLDLQVRGGSTSAIGYWTLLLSVDVAGLWVAWVYPQGSSPKGAAALGLDSVLATGGALATGKVGIYDAFPAFVSYTRTYDNFAAWGPAANAVIFPSRTARFLHDMALRQNAGGTSEGAVPVFEGKHLRLPPATRAGRKSRLVVKIRDFDVDSGLPDAGLTSRSVNATLNVTPRVALLSK
jgi:hypothetical protein